MLYSRNLLFIYFYLKWLVSANLKLLIYKISFKHIMWCNILEQTLEMLINQNFLQDVIYFLFSQCSLHIELPYAFFFFWMWSFCCLPPRPPIIFPSLPILVCFLGFPPSPPTLFIKELFFFLFRTTFDQSCIIDTLDNPKTLGYKTSP